MAKTKMFPLKVEAWTTQAQSDAIDQIMGPLADRSTKIRLLLEMGLRGIGAQQPLQQPQHHQQAAE